MSKDSLAIRMATRRPGRFPKASLGNILWLTIVWVLLWGEVTGGNILAGLILALVVTTISPFPLAAYDGRFRVWGILRLVGIFIYDLVRASVEQALFILSRKKPRAAVIRVALRSESDFYLTLTSALSTLVPGTMVIYADAPSGTLYIHIFDVEMAGGIAKAHQDVLDLEERVMRALATDGELIRAGFVPGSSPKAGRMPVPFVPDSPAAFGPDSARSDENLQAEGAQQKSGAPAGSERAGNEPAANVNPKGGAA